MERNTVIELLNKKPEMQEKIFARGFLLTNKEIDDNAYPFYGKWIRIGLKNHSLFYHPQMKVSCFDGDAYSFAMVGHAYNPFSMVHNEKEILKGLDEKINSDKEAFFEDVNQLTGVFTLLWTDGKQLWFLGDATGMQTTFYSINEEGTYISSHTNLIGDLLSLERDPYVKELSSYKYFKLLGNALPGDLTQFSQVKRVVPNHYYSVSNGAVSAERFYTPAKLNLTREEIVEGVSKIMHSNMALIAEKWNRAAISMTGGCDSKTTLACANGNYDKFSYFSYISSDEEQVDAEAANKICSSMGLDHKIFNISKDDNDFENIEAVRTVLMWNAGDLRATNKNDVRKRAFFDKSFEYDVEVKSWVSEVGRAYYSKRFNGRKKFGEKPTPRKCTTMYKFFFHNRRLVKKTDRAFEMYLNKYFKQSDIAPIEWQEQFFWEFRVPSWNGLVITGEHRYSFDITIPYNNRKLLELLLSAPIEDRINDTVYKCVRAKMNPKVDDLGIAVTNIKHTNKRAVLENIYYVLHSKIPF